MTFKWEEITDELLEKVVCFSYDKPCGAFEFTGQADYLHVITENGQEYLFGLDECPRVNFEYEILDRLLGECPIGFSDQEIARWRCDRYDKMKRTGEIGKWRWEDSLYGNVFIRDDYYDRIYPEWKKQREERIISATQVTKKLFDPQGKLPRKVLAETQAKRNKSEKV